jgi:hypothetical protein
MRLRAKREFAEMPVKLLIAYSLKPGREETYYRFMMAEFLPALQDMGLTMAEAWQTAWGSYPQRLIGLLAEEQTTVEETLASQRWREIEDKLLRYVTGYQRKLVPARSGFQFFEPT